MSAASHHQGQAPYYFVPSPSAWPVLTSIGLFFVILGAGQWVNGHQWGAYSLFFGLIWWAVIMFRWFGEAIGESEGGLYGKRVDVSFRWSMSWFIFSEVMFFAAFFGALFWARVYSVPSLGNIDHSLLWPDFRLPATRCFGLRATAVQPASSRDTGPAPDTSPGSTAWRTGTI